MHNKIGHRLFFPQNSPANKKKKSTPAHSGKTGRGEMAGLGVIGGSQASGLREWRDWVCMVFTHQ